MSAADVSPGISVPLPPLEISHLEPFHQVTSFDMATPGCKQQGACLTSADDLAFRYRDRRFARRPADRFADDLADLRDDFRAALDLSSRFAPLLLGCALALARFALFVAAAGLARRAGERFGAALRLRLAGRLGAGIGSGSDGDSIPRAREITLEIVEVI